MRKKQKLIAIGNSEMELWQPQENTLMQKLRKQKAQGRLCDVVFIHGDVKIYSHACVLASCSPYMMELLFEDSVIYRNDWCIKTPLSLNLTAILKQPEHVCCECFKNVIDYMYTDKIDMHKCHPNHVEYAATSLRISKLIHICLQYNISEKTTTVTLNSTDNEQIVENCTSNTELMPNGIAGLLKNRECSENMYHFRYQEEVSLTAHSKEKVSRESTFLPETEAPNNVNLKPVQNLVIKESHKINSKNHDRITCKPYSKSKSSKVATDMLDIKINQNKENFAGKPNIIRNSIVYDNQNNYKNVTDECLNMTDQKAECRPNDNIMSRTNIMTKTLGKRTFILGHECNNKFSTPTTGTKISANLNKCNKTVKLCKNNKEGKYNASVDAKHSFYPNNCIQSDSLCERSNSTNKSDARITISYNESQKLGYHESIGNSRINIGNTNNSFTCDICQYKTSDLYNIVNHLEKNDHNQRHCAICTYIFRDNKEFKMHLEVHKEKKPFLCLECNKTFIRLCNFNKHLFNHHNEKPLTCSICKATFRFQQSFHRHMISKHNKNKGRMYICEHCSYSALTRSDLTAHLNNCIQLSRYSEPNYEFETGRRKVSSVLHNNKNSKIPIKSKTTFTAKKIHNKHKSENHFTDVSNIVRFECSYCKYWTPKEILYKKHVKKWHSQNKKSLNSPVYNMKNSVITLPTANNSSPLTGKNDTEVSERNSGFQCSIERGLLISNDSNSIDNKQMTNVSQHHCTQIDKNEHNLLLMSNSEQLQKINAEVILPINNTQVTNITNAVPTHFTATNGIVLLLNVDDHQNVYRYSSLPLIQPSAKEQLPDDFQLTSENSDNSITLYNVVDNSCKRLDTMYSSDAFSTESLLRLENSGDENNIEYFIPITHCTEEFSAVADLQNVTTIKNVDKVLCESTSNELVHSTNSENDLITTMSNNSFNEQVNIMFLDQEQSQSYLSGVCDPCMSDGIQDIFQMDSITEVTDNVEYNEFFSTNL